MSLIGTCELCGANPFDYLTELDRHANQMTQDIEDCLQVVVQALTKCDLPPGDIVAWCKAMTKNDRVGCIYDRELGALRKHAEASAT